MMILAKLALGTATTLAFATAYTFHEGTLRVDVDEHRSGGSHVHFWAPAAVVPMAARFVPDDKLHQASRQLREYAPLIKVAIKELRRYPDTTFVAVDDDHEHVRISTVGSKVQIDVEDPGETVHVAVPLAMIEDVLTQIAERQPSSGPAS